MIFQHRPAAVNTSAPPRVNSFSPDSPTPSKRATMRKVAPWLAQAGPNRLRYRARFLWTDASTPSGQREEIVVFSDPRRLLTLLQQIAEKPDRPLISQHLEAVARPRWEPIPLEYLRSRAAQRDRRDAQRKGGAR